MSAFCLIPKYRESKTLLWYFKNCLISEIIFVQADIMYVVRQMLVSVLYFAVILVENVSFEVAANGFDRSRLDMGQ